MYKSIIENTAIVRRYFATNTLQEKRRVHTMRAWQTSRYGGPQDVQLNSAAEIPIVRNLTDVLVKVEAASVNPLDVGMLKGYGSTALTLMRQITNRSFTSQEFPLILGRDFSGTVAHVGKCVLDLKCGDEVWGVTLPQLNGSHADYVLTNAYFVTKKPNVLTHTEAASLPYAALTAWSAIETFGELKSKSCHGKRVLVTGASGGVGTFAVQLLKSWGAEVSVTCSADAVELLQNLGADNVLDYQSPDFRSDLKQLQGFDFILDNVGGLYPQMTMDLMKPWSKSQYVTLVSPLLKNIDDRGLICGTLLSGLQATYESAKGFKNGRSLRWAYFIPYGYALKTITTMVNNKQILPVIEKVYKFEETPLAYEKMLQGHARGKTVIDFTLPNAEESEHPIEQTKGTVT